MYIGKSENWRAFRGAALKNRVGGGDPLMADDLQQPTKQGWGIMVRDRRDNASGAMHPMAARTSSGEPPCGSMPVAMVPTTPRLSFA